MNNYFIVLIIIVNLPIFLYVLKKTYKTKEDLIKSIEYEAKPDLISLFDGKILEDMKYEQKSRNFYFYISIILLMEYLLYKGIMTLVDKF